jgi:hypothetical protein
MILEFQRLRRILEFSLLTGLRPKPPGRTGRPGKLRDCQWLGGRVEFGPDDELLRLNHAAR